MKPRQILLSVVGAIVFVALLAYGSYRTHFRWDILGQQMHQVLWPNLALGVLLIYSAFVVRSYRWTVFVRPAKRLPPFSLIGTQVMGFTAVALLGRVADLTRPYLVARKARLLLPSQFAVYTVERMFDACSMATIVGTALMLAPNQATMPHREIAMAVARTALIGASILVIMAVSVRAAGERLALLCESALGARIGVAIAAKLRAFREGLAVVSSVSALVQAALLSLLMWAMISAAYLFTVRAFAASPVLGSMTLGRAVILMAASMAGSAVPIPIVSWFAQILVLQQTLEHFYGIAPEIALACGTGITFVTFLCIIPVGLLWSRFDHVSLRQVSAVSEHEAEELQNHAEA